MNTMHTNETLSVMVYFANAFNKAECEKIYGGGEFSLGEHIWNKYRQYQKEEGMYGAYSKLIFELDSNNLNKLIERACELYDGRRNR